MRRPDYLPQLEPATQPLVPNISKLLTQGANFALMTSDVTVDTVAVEDAQVHHMVQRAALIGALARTMPKYDTLHVRANLPAPELVVRGADDVLEVAGTNDDAQTVITILTPDQPCAAVLESFWRNSVDRAAVDVLPEVPRQSSVVFRSTADLATSCSLVSDEAVSYYRTDFTITHPPLIAVEEK